MNSTPTLDVDTWSQSAPELGGTAGEDANRLAGHVTAGENLLSTLPARPDRDPGQQRIAECVLDSVRRLRDRFLTRHAEEVYAVLTNGRRVHLRLADLVRAAAERFPGLVPTAAQLDAERAHVQADKDGLEIDLGVFFRGLLRVPLAGAHLADAMLLATPRAVALRERYDRTGRVELATVLLERHDGTGHLTVQNGHCLNAEDEALIADMETAVDLVLLDPQTRVGVLRGGVMTHPKYRGRRVFSAGINLDALRDGRIPLVDFLLGRELGYLSKLAGGLLDPAAFPHTRLQKPWLGVVDSFAIGGGMQLLLVLDRIIAADDAYFSLPAAQEGIVPGVANLRLGRLVGSRLARRVILGGHTIHATDPEAALICDQVVPADELDATAAAAVRELDSPAVVANRRMIALAEEPPDRFRSYLAEFALTQALRLYGADVIAKVSRRKS
ncbi:MAG TPA: (3,5-dihydroxyphenyl)acetyl-CoA 1,2-dioxygenase DpgC [Actinophytocola sp.]|jgi:thioesterase DpgC|uniref:(3,5-dihydroxyphenyl)acetyl-CoA 1,2-dioxygenase DpgC n=1 Tax=Actinophytocola sp. TaxID=1872138 RepID=UPI002F92191D